MGAEQHRHKQLYDCKVEGKPSKEGEMVCNRVYQIKWNLPPHKQQVVHFDRLKPYLNRQEEQGPTADQATMSDSEKTNEEVEDMYDDMSIHNGLLEMRPLQLCSMITMYCQTMFQYSKRSWRMTRLKNQK